MFLQEVAEIKFAFPEKGQGTSLCDAFWVTAANLRPNNEILDLKHDSIFIPDDSLLLQNDDILIKRITPQFVNFVTGIDDKYYVSSNLIIIRTKNGCSAKYLAYVLESNIEKLYQDTVGSVIPAIGRKGICELEIGNMPPLDRQKAIGELWCLLKEKGKLTKKLYEKEAIKLKQQLKNCCIKGDK